MSGNRERNGPTHTVVWRRVDVPGLEHFQMREGPNGVELQGTVVAIEEGIPMRLEYSISCSPCWETRLVAGNFTTAEATYALNLRADEYRRWWSEEDQITDLAGLVDIDLSLTPGTNILAVRRLNLLDMPIGDVNEVSSAYVLFPKMEVKPLSQRYTRLASHRFRYESLEDTFTTEIEVDDAGLVASYGGLWERVWPLHSRRTELT